MAFFFRQQPTELRGYVDAIQDSRVIGWAWDHASKGKRVQVEVFSAGNQIGSIRADRFRKDLLDSGIGDGQYGFEFELPTADVPRETLALKIARSDFWLINNTDPLPLAEVANRGLPLLQPGISAHAVDAGDLAVAVELQQLWKALRPEQSSSAFIGRNTMWTGIVASRHQPLVALLGGADVGALAAHLVALHRTNASEGLAQGERAYLDFLSATANGRRAGIVPFHAMLAALAQSIGVERVECEEQGVCNEAIARPSEELVAAIERVLGHSIVPPTIFDGLYGLQIGDRILHGRDIQALYAAMRAIEASGVPVPRILEIGGGFGQAAYYAWLRGIRHYTIVDLPSVAAMQYFYLRRALPGIAVRFRDPSRPQTEDEGIDLLFASQLEPTTRLSADIALNCDSFPEMGDETCARYFTDLPRWTPLLLSINQEANQRLDSSSGRRQTVVGSLLPRHGFTRLHRFRHWIRKGYVEELWRSPSDGYRNEGAARADIA